MKSGINDMWPIVGALIASTLAFVELHSQKRKPLSPKASHWILLRLAADGAAGLMAYGLLRLAFGDLNWFTPLWTALTSGLVGPALLRSQLSLLGSGDETSVGPATAFRKLQKHADHNVDDISAAAQSNWIYSVALPALNVPDGLTQLAARGDMYIASLERLSDVEREESRAFISVTAGDSSGQDERIIAIVQHLLDAGGQRFVRSTVKEFRAKVA